MLKITIASAKNNNAATVTKEGALVTAISNIYSPEDAITNVPVGRFLTVAGDGVTSNLNVNGATTNVDAYIGSNTQGDIYLTGLNIVIADTAVDLNKFGALSPLANGVLVYYEITRQRSELPIDFKTSFDFVRLSSSMSGTGGKIDAFKMANVGTTSSDAYSINIDLTRWSPLGFGIRLRQNEADRFGVLIRDDLTGLDDFSVLCTGYMQILES